MPVVASRYPASHSLSSSAPIRVPCVRGQLKSTGKPQKNVSTPPLSLVMRKHESGLLELLHANGKTCLVQWTSLNVNVLATRQRCALLSTLSRPSGSSNCTQLISKEVENIFILITRIPRPRLTSAILQQPKDSPPLPPLLPRRVQGSRKKTSREMAIRIVEYFSHPPWNNHYPSHAPPLHCASRRRSRGPGRSRRRHVGKRWRRSFSPRWRKRRPKNAWKRSGSTRRRR